MIIALKKRPFDFDDMKLEYVEYLTPEYLYARPLFNATHRTCSASQYPMDFMRLLEMIFIELHSQYEYDDSATNKRAMIDA